MVVRLPVLPGGSELHGRSGSATEGVTGHSLAAAKRVTSERGVHVVDDKPPSELLAGQSLM